MFRKLSEFVFEVKFYFDTGKDFLSIASFVLLVITASDKLLPVVGPYLGLEHLSHIVILLIPLGFVATIVFGAVMLHVADYKKIYEKKAMKHSYYFDRIFNELDDIKDALRKDTEVDR